MLFKMRAKVLFVMVCLYLRLSAQQNFISGYVITHEGDTLRGHIDYQQWTNSPAEFGFKPFGSDEIKILKPTDLQYFYVEKPNELYGSVTTTITSRSSKYATLSSSEVILFSGFARVLLEGHVSLYMIRFKNLTYYILRLPDNSFKELTLKRIAVTQNGITSIRDFHVYRNYLKEFEKDCESLAGLSERLKYSEKDFILFVSNYNNCHSANYVVVSTLQKKIVATKGIMLSVNNSQYVISDSYSEVGAGQKVKGYGFTAGVSLLAGYPHGRWGLSVDFLYKFLRLENNVNFYKVFAQYEGFNKFNMDLLKLTAQVRHTSVSGKVRPYIGGGITASVPLRSEAVAHYRRIDLSNPETKIFKGKGEMGFVFEGGLKVKKGELGLRTERLLYQKNIFTEGQVGHIVIKYYLSRPR